MPLPNRVQPELQHADHPCSLIAVDLSYSTTVLGVVEERRPLASETLLCLRRESHRAIEGVTMLIPTAVAEPQTP